MLAWVAGYIPRWYAHPKTVTHSSTNRSIVLQMGIELTTIESQVRRPNHHTAEPSLAPNSLLCADGAVENLLTHSPSHLYIQHKSRIQDLGRAFVRESGDREPPVGWQSSGGGGERLGDIVHRSCSHLPIILRRRNLKESKTIFCQLSITDGDFSDERRGHLIVDY